LTQAPSVKALEAATEADRNRRRDKRAMSGAPRWES
jgi:hypothetical protein